MDARLVDKFKQWWEGIPVDGWVEVENGHMFVELFPQVIKNFKLKHGDFVRISVVRKEDIDGQEIKPSVPPDTGGGLLSGLPIGPSLRSS